MLLTYFDLFAFISQMTVSLLGVFKLADQEARKSRDLKF